MYLIIMNVDNLVANLQIRESYDEAIHCAVHNVCIIHDDLDRDQVHNDFQAGWSWDDGSKRELSVCIVHVDNGIVTFDPPKVIMG